MRRIIFCLLLVVTTLESVRAQRNIESVLRQVEGSSSELQARRELTAAQQIEARTGNSLPDPTVEMESLWGGTQGVNNSELTIAQPFDFPSVYASRNKLARLRAGLYDSEGAAFRQQLLLEAKQLCIEVIYLHRMREMLNRRLQAAEELEAMYRRKLDSGENDRLAYNKIKVEQIAARTEAGVKESEWISRCQQLARLTGQSEDRFEDLTYPAVEALPALEQIRELYMAPQGNPELAGLEQEQQIGERTEKLSRSMALPRFEVGYRHDFGAEGRFKGFKVGMSLPLFESRNRVRAARAQTTYAKARLASAREINQSELQQLYDQAATLQQSLQAMESLQPLDESAQLLRRALDTGEISLVEYVTQMSQLYNDRAMLLQIERDYQQVTSALYRFAL
ncbi:MAG: TolC family protein [Alistipes sp.]|nr:TolC family protein [Alistipes sp.]